MCPFKKIPNRTYNNTDDDYYSISIDQITIVKLWFYLTGINICIRPVILESNSIVTYNFRVMNHEVFFMNRSDYYFDLPQELIAQYPADPRDHSRLLVMDRLSGKLEDRVFYNIVDYLRDGDVIVINNSKVIPARLYRKKKTGANIEILLLKQLGNNSWECLVRPGKRLQKGTEVIISEELGLYATVDDYLEDGKRTVTFSYPDSTNFYTILDEVGKMPVPPYITKELENNDDYQTVYAKPLGSAAAPTAGLHYTEELIEKIKQNGVEFAEVTLHVGLGTFRPVKEEDITKHIMHSESYSIDEKNAGIIQKAKDEGRRVICTGTTSCRTLESIYAKYHTICACHEDTDIFIYPGYEFKVMDGLITNFHLPESTLIMLVCAFAGYENTMNAYKHAVDDKYRFFSFGDAMLIT